MLLLPMLLGGDEWCGFGGRQWLDIVAVPGWNCSEAVEDLLFHGMREP